jgi:hypothetical protein
MLQECHCSSQSLTDGLLLRIEVSRDVGGRQVRDVPDHGAGVAVQRSVLLLVFLVVHDEVGLGRVQPALVGVVGA